MSALPFSISLWNANGLKATTIHDVLTHSLFSDMLIITESWLSSPMQLPTDWQQFHLYGQKVANANNRGKGGIAVLFNPLTQHPVIQIPSPHELVISFKLGDLRIHCTYLPPSMHNDQVFDVFHSIPLLPNTIICGDINARLGPFLGDYAQNSRGIHLEEWVKDRQMYILNETLAHGIPTFVGSRLGNEISSIVDLFITNITPTTLANSSLTIASDLSLSSDHRLMTLSFDFVPPNIDVHNDKPLAPRRLWNLSKLNKPDIAHKYKTTFGSLVRPLQQQLKECISSPPATCPPLDTFNDQLNDCIYKALDDTVGAPNKKNAYWKKYWTQDLQDAATNRDDCYRRWRHSVGVDKLHRWDLFKTAEKDFRRKVQKRKRESWKTFCASLEKSYSKATTTISRIKRRHESSSLFTHPEGPAKAVEVMSTHLASVYDGSLLAPNTHAPPTSPLNDSLLYDVATSSVLNVDNIMFHLKRLPSNKAPGPDHIKAEMLKPLGHMIAGVLTYLFKLCWQWSSTPTVWRQATVFPIHKKGDKNNPANYRPISLTSVMRKWFEMVISYSVVSHSPPIDPAQGGFREQRSPLDQALCLHDLMHDYFLSHRHYPSVVFLDIKSAYDTVDRSIVWQTLADAPNFPPGLLPLLRNLFDEVSVSVLLSNHTSEPFHPKTGLLQGSVLSPHLYSIYINSLPNILRKAVTPASRTTAITPPGNNQPVYLNSLLFADDVAIFGTRDEIQAMLLLAEQHSKDLGYRWNPSKCAVLNAPRQNFFFTLYNEPLPTVETFTYLGMPFVKKGLDGPGILAKRKQSSMHLMHLFNKIGINRNGFSLLLCTRLYTTFIRPMFEYGLAISRLSATDIKALEAHQNKIFSMILGSHHTTAAKHITCIPGMVHRYNTLVTRYVLRSKYLPEDSLVVLLKNQIRYPRLIHLLQENILYKSLQEPIPDSRVKLTNLFKHHWQNYCDQQIEKLAGTRKQILLRACRPCTYKPDPILYLPMDKTSRSRLVRWRLGRFTAMGRVECPCADHGTFISRDHFLTCRAIEPGLIDCLPPAPSGINRIDFALSSLPTKASQSPPAFWPALLTLLWYIDTLCHPLKNIPEDPDPGSSWFCYPV